MSEIVARLTTLERLETIAPLQNIASSDTCPDLIPDQAQDVARPYIRGKFFYVAGQRLCLKGTTYGTFRPTKDGSFPPVDVVRRDFGLMALYGMNTVRTYTVPPQWLLDLAVEYGLRIMVGVPWEQHITFLHDRRVAQSIRKRMSEAVRQCSSHPATLCYAIGNEVPAPIARWYGKGELERFLKQLYEIAKEEDPEGIVSYVNYPSTEYLELPFLDFVCFNVYLENKALLERYLPRLHHLAGNRPVVLAEIGLDSKRHGETEQAYALDWQIRTAIAAGCAGALVFAWTDEWHRGGHEIKDWDFGLTTRDRQPKAALYTVANALGQPPFAQLRDWPRVSVVVCTHNGARTLRECLGALERLDYPDYEVIVIDDGSTDGSNDIAVCFDCRLITTPNQGLSSARNIGWQAATGDIVAYIDDDAYPEPDWLRHLAATLDLSAHVAVGGPNVGPRGDGFMAECVFQAPGGPMHVMLDDRCAEHIPGCNMAFRREALNAIGGFDPQFRVAGDDVDICWRLQERGWTIGFSPAALVWHHRRNSVKAYWKQQLGYGKSEALLERKWPEKYNCLGHAKWNGRIYGTGIPRLLGCCNRIYHGKWGSAPFQSLHYKQPDVWRLLPTLPEWHLITAVLAALAGLSILWPKLYLTRYMLLAALATSVIQAAVNGWCAVYRVVPQSRFELFRYRAATAFLHFIHPIARLLGRMRHGLTLWRSRLPSGFSVPRLRTVAIWSECWQAPENQLSKLKVVLREVGALAQDGGQYDRWDIEIKGGLAGGVRLLMVVEEHGCGKQMFRFRIWPVCSFSFLLATGALMTLVWSAYADGVLAACSVLLASLLMLCVRAVQECGSATAVAERAIRNAGTAPSNVKAA
ncbi:MAG TPA: glycosyltransferase [Candidatus Limnocylindrales bacterium]|jgi:GT2 family glycosyltransferase|nr:glycosyltransferase [Candidatus Limnocylindrales bacterium]